MITIGRYIQQKGNYKAFIPEKFPPKGLFFHEPKIIKLLSDANLLLGKLDKGEKCGRIFVYKEYLNLFEK
jgi:hypothetical protein